MPFDTNMLIKELSKQVKDFASIRADSEKIKGDLILNQMKQKQNFFFKQQEQAADPKYQGQKLLQSRYNRQAGTELGPHGATMAPEAPTAISPKVTLGPSGYSEATKAPTATQSYSTDIIKAEKGEATWDQLSQKYPTKREELMKFKNTAEFGSKKLEKPILRGTQSKLDAGRLRGDIAYMNVETQDAAAKIKTYQDLMDMHRDADDLEALGVDVSQIAKYYKDEYEQLNEKGLL